MGKGRSLPPLSTGRTEQSLLLFNLNLSLQGPLCVGNTAQERRGARLKTSWVPLGSCWPWMKARGGQTAVWEPREAEGGQSAQDSDLRLWVGWRVRLPLISACCQPNRVSSLPSHLAENHIPSQPFMSDSTLCAKYPSQPLRYEFFSWGLQRL